MQPWDSTPEATSYETSARNVSFVIRCAYDFSCSNGSSLPQAWVTILDSMAVVEDPDPPAVAPLVGALLDGVALTDGRIEVAASDATSSVELSAGGVSVRAARSRIATTRGCSRVRRASRRRSTSTRRRWVMGHSDPVGDRGRCRSPAGRGDGDLARVDRTAPAAPKDLVIARNPDGTYALSWTNPPQGTASPIVAALVQVCPAWCVTRRGSCPAGTSGGSSATYELAGGKQTIKVWLEDERAKYQIRRSSNLAVGPDTIEHREGRGHLAAGPGERDCPSPRLKLTRARRSGAILTLSGTIARSATARTLPASRRDGRRRRWRPLERIAKKGKWSMRIRLTIGLRRSSAFYVSVSLRRPTSFAEDDAAAEALEEASRPAGAPRRSSASRRGRRRGWVTRPRRRAQRDAGELLGRDRAAEQEALAEAAAERAQRVGLLGLLDALGDRARGPSDSPMATIACSSALSSHASRVKERSIFSTSIGKRRR